jgi:hypothetical protein
VATVRWLAAEAGSSDLPAIAGEYRPSEDHFAEPLAALHDPELFVAEVRQLFSGQHVRAGRLGSDPARTVSRPDVAVA